jgi:hypothetical protein
MSGTPAKQRREEVRGPVRMQRIAYARRLHAIALELRAGHEFREAMRADLATAAEAHSRFILAAVERVL